MRNRLADTLKEMEVIAVKEVSFNTKEIMERSG